MNSSTGLSKRIFARPGVSIAVATVVVMLVLLPMASAQQISVKWYHGDEEVRAIAPNVQYTAVIKIYSDKLTQALVEIKTDNINWLDTVIASKEVTLNPGENIIEIPFVFAANVVSEDGSVPSVLKNTRGIFVKIGGFLDLSDVNTRLASDVQVPLLSYYWLNLRMYVNGERVDEKSYPPVKIGDRVKITGYLYEGDGHPIPGAIIKYIGVVDEINGQTSTDGSGYFSINTVAPDWSKYFLCGSRATYLSISARISGQEVAYWPFKCTCVCEQKPEAAITITDVAGYTATASMFIAGLYLIARRFLRA